MKAKKQASFYFERETMGATGEEGNTARR